MEKLKYIKIEHEDGTLSENVPIGADASNIDVSASKTLNTKLSELDNDIENINNKTTNILPITMNKLGNEVKAALTGGSTPYVGLHSIGEEELKYDIPISYIKNLKSTSNYINFDNKTENTHWNYNTSTNRMERVSFNNLYSFDPIYLKGGKSYSTVQQCRGIFCWLLNGTFDPDTGECDGTVERILTTDKNEKLNFLVTNDSYCFITTYGNIGTQLQLIESSSDIDDKIFNIVTRTSLQYGEYIYADEQFKITTKNYIDSSITPDKVSFLNKIYVNDNYIDPSKLIDNHFVRYYDGCLSYNSDWYVTDFIEVIPGETLYWGAQNHGCQIAFYDNNYNFVTGALIDSATTIEVPNNENIKYFVGSISKPTSYRSFLGRISSLYAPYSVKYNFKDNVEIDIEPNKTGLLKKYTSSKQLFDKNTITEGIFLYYVTGQPAQQEEYFESDFIDTSANEHIYFNPRTSGMQICFFDENKNFINGISMDQTASNVKDFTVPDNDNVRYFRINQRLTNLDTFAIMKNEPAYYEPYEEYYKLKQEYLTNLFYVVDKNGEGDFTTLTSAVSAVPNNSIIFVKPGLYEEEKVKAWTKELYIIGASKEACIITNTTNNYSNPPIEMGPGLLKNLTIWAQDGEGTEQYRDYAVHVETNLLQNKSLIIENCVLHAANNAGLGMGMRGGCNVYLINSELKSDTTYGLFFHDSENVDYVGIQNFYLRNNLIWSENGTTFMRMDSQCRDGSIINLEFINNVMRSLGSIKDNYTKRNARETTTTAEDFLDLKNFRLKLTSYGNNHNSFNVSRETN